MWRLSGLRYVGAGWFKHVEADWVRHVEADWIGVRGW